MSSEPMDCATVDEAAGAFVLGALDQGELEAIRTHLASCIRGHPELAELGGVVPYLALDAEPLEPSDEVRRRILEQISGGASRQPVAARRSGLKLDRVRWAAFALVAVVILGIGAGGLLLSRISDTRAYTAHEEAASALAAKPGSRSVDLVPAAGGGPSGSAVIAADGQGIVLVQGLPATTGRQVFEVWLIAAGGGAPEPAGSLSTTADGRGWLETSAGRGELTVAITLEPGPGATTPTLPILTSGSTG